MQIYIFKNIHSLTLWFFIIFHCVWHDISDINIYIQQTYTCQNVGSIYPIQIYISKNVHPPTLCPKGTQKPYNLHSSPKCWPVISNIKIYFNCHRLPTLLAAYIKYKCSLSNPVPEGHTETLLLTFIPQMLA